MMASDFPQLEQFQVRAARDGLVHLVFDMPGRTMNVFSNAAIHELGLFARWLRDADVRGVVIRSGKDSAFCAGADLGELGVAYDMIVAARPEDRFDIAFDHFFPLSKAIRALETAGKPVAVAIAGLALGGGCELALGGHYRVLADDPRAALGLPESLVGLLPGGGGTQRLPRLIGVAAALPVLLDAARLSGQAAVDAGLVHALAAPGEEVALAEAWLLSAPDPVQPWDRPDHVPASHHDIAAIIAAERATMLRETRGHYPAPLAILDCVEQGFVQSFDAAIRTEMSIFADLIKRPEPRDMIQTLFLGKTDYERAARKDAVPAAVREAVATLGARIDAAIAETPALAAAGFGAIPGDPVQMRAGRDYWIAGDAATEARARLSALAEAAMPFLALSPQEQRMADYALVTGHGFPAYLGGPLAMAVRQGGREARGP
jgi:3-hydroxyacyl-CoA dehydrogenase/enoyl-CoA hydratase/3-hydroxybutyryl-CoA epimerase